MPAATAALMPLVLSSMTRHDLGFTPSLSAASKNMSGCGFPRDTISALNTLPPNLSVRSRIERQSCKRSIELEDAMHRYVGERLNELAGPAYLREVGTKSIKNRELEIVRKTPRQRLAYRGLDRRNGIVPSSPGVVFK